MKINKVMCKNCNELMILESTDLNNTIYLCKKCKNEIKIIPIKNGGVF